MKQKPIDPLNWNAPAIILEDTFYLDIFHDVVADWKGKKINLNKINLNK